MKSFRLTMEEEMLPVIVPVVAYWVASGFYQFFLSPKESHRLFPLGEEEAKNAVSKKQVLVGVLVNQALQMVVASTMFTVSEEKKAAHVESSLLQLMKQLAIAVLVMDCWEYFWHRWTHENEFLYRHVHAMHHHLIVPYAFGAQYIHPLDAIPGELLGSAVALHLSGMSPRMAAIFFSLLSIKGVDDHCGQWFPRLNPIHRFMMNNAAFHTVHHQHQGFKHNYSVHFLSTWDLLLGTYLPYVVEKRKGGGYEILTSKDK